MAVVAVESLFISNTAPIEETGLLSKCVIDIGAARVAQKRDFWVNAQRTVCSSAGAKWK